jgi:hypothetical protein
VPTLLAATSTAQLHHHRSTCGGRLMSAASGKTGLPSRCSMSCNLQQPLVASMPISVMTCTELAFQAGPACMQWSSETQVKELAVR